MPTSLEEFIAAGPWPQRAVIRALIPLARRARGRTILSLVPGADQALSSLDAMGHYDRPEVAARLGWDADAVSARGRELRRTEGRP